MECLLKASREKLSRQQKAVPQAAFFLALLRKALVFVFLFSREQAICFFFPPPSSRWAGGEIVALSDVPPKL